MSGIAAIVDSKRSDANEGLIKEMALMMAMRGPHYQQYWYNGDVAMTHTLLPTSIESKNESQPSTLDGDVWIAADARIDARIELIGKLQRQFPNISKYTTDDKLILSAYQHWGLQCFDHMIGDFAFILWDSSKQRLLCATDQFGVAPMYYAKTPHGICISNTLNAIRLHPEVRHDLDQLAIADYLLFRINENNHGTFFEHIKHLPAGHFLIFENNTLQVKRYWQFESRGEIRHLKPDEHIEEFSHLLKQSISDRSRTNSVGVHLSGGMDSSSVTAIANEIRHEQNPLNKVVAYTYGASGELSDLETPYARQIAEKFNIEHHVLAGSDNELKQAHTPPYLRSPEPRFTTRDTSNYDLLKHVSTHSNTLMTGFGGDPLLQTQGLRVGDFDSPQKIIHMFKQAKYHWALFGKHPPLGLRASAKLEYKRKDILKRQVPTWINAEFSEKQQLNTRLRSIIERKIDPTKAQQSMTTGGLWRRIFCWNDPGFTHIPVKVVHPFFDTRLLELTQSSPPFPWLHNKTILRQAMQNYLPENVISRPKTPLPGNGLQSVLASGLETSYYEHLLDNPKLSDFIDPTPLKATLMDSRNSHKSDFKSIMRVTTLSDWLNTVSSLPTKSSTNGNINNVKRIKY